jgi:hypothetical protein
MKKSTALSINTRAASQRRAVDLPASTPDSRCEPVRSCRKNASSTETSLPGKKTHKAGCKRQSVQLLIHPGTGNEPNGADDHNKKELVISNTINTTAMVFSICVPACLKSQHISTRSACEALLLYRKLLLIARHLAHALPERWIHQLETHRLRLLRLCDNDHRYSAH